MEVYDKNTLKARLPNAVICTNDYEKGVKLRRKENAVQHSYIAINNDFYDMAVILDIDNPTVFKEMKWYDLGLPHPNVVALNQDNTKCHLSWFLQTPVCKTDAARLKPMTYLAKIQYAFKNLLGDKNYTGLLTKNPLNEEKWRVIWYEIPSYNLDELCRWVELPEKITKQIANESDLGRNCYLFDAVRKIAYKWVLEFKKNSNYEAFKDFIMGHLQQKNTFKTPLSHNELTHIAKSISKWTWRHFSIEKFSEIQKARRTKRAEKEKIFKEGFLCELLKN